MQKRTILLITVFAVAGAVVLALVLPLVVGRVAVTLSGQNDSGVSGSAELRNVQGRLQVTLELTGQPEGIPQPAHIHSGTCEELGGVVFGLEPSLDGGSVTMLDISLDDLHIAGPYAINVHQSAQEAQNYVACGEISL